MKNQLFFCLLASLAILFSACNNDHNSIGLGLNGELLGTNFSDTTTISAYSVLEDTINTTKLSANVLGSLHDPVFGNSSADIYAQFDLSGTSTTFGTDATLDSAVLTLQISSYYGDTTSKVDIRAYQLSEDLNSSTRYYQTSTASHNSNALNYSLSGYSINPTSSIVIDTGTYSPHLRIRLSQEFGQYLLDNQSQMSSSTVFKNFFKGLCISAVAHTGNTGYMLISSMTSSLTGITLYYHTARKASAKYTFPCKSSCARFTHFEHDYNASTNSDFNQEILMGQTNIGASKLFVQATGGVKTKIKFPYLKDAFKSVNNRVVINRAELVITNVEPDEVYLIQPTTLALQGIKESTGQIAYIPDDEYYTSSDYYGGTYNSTTKEFRFRITEYVQQQILQTSPLSNTLYLVVKGSSVRANRLVFGGTGLQDNNRLRLELSYTTY